MPFSDPSSPLVGATSRTKAAQYELRNAWPQDDGSADEIIGGWTRRRWNAVRREYETFGLHLPPDRNRSRGRLGSRRHQGWDK